MAQNSRKIKRAKVDQVEVEDEQYALSFKKFLQQRKEEQGEDEGNEEGEHEEKDDCVDSYEFINCDANNDENDEGYEINNTEPAVVMNIPAPPNTPTPKITTSTPNKQKDPEKDKLNVRENRAHHARLFKVQKQQNEDSKRLRRLEDMMTGQSTDDSSILTIWPVENRQQLLNIERAMHRSPKKTKKNLRELFMRGDRRSIYDFLHSNLESLLSRTGRWTWTGKPSKPKIHCNKSTVEEEILDEKIMEPANEEETDAVVALLEVQNESDLFSKSSPANQLKTVSLLHDICHELFKVATANDLVKETQRALTNLNNAYQKRVKRAAEVAFLPGPSTR